MASIAPSRSGYEKNSISPLPRVGALLLVLLVTAAGIAPIIPRGDESSTIESGGQAQIEEQATVGPGSTSFFDRSTPVPQEGSGAAGAEAAPAADPAETEAAAQAAP